MRDKFIAILAHQRSGTHLLGSCLDSHPEIEYIDEIFDRRRVESEGQLKKILSRFEGKEKFLCLDVKYNQITLPIERFLQNIKVIHLIRRDIKAMYFSGRLHGFYKRKLRVKGTTGERVARYQEIAKSQKQIPKIPFNQGKFDKWAKGVERGRAKYSYLEDLRFHYEDLTGNKQIKTLPKWASEDICEFLGIEYCSLTTSNIKFSPTNIEELWSD